MLWVSLSKKITLITNLPTIHLAIIQKVKFKRICFETCDNNDVINHTNVICAIGPSVNMTLAIVFNCKKTILKFKLISRLLKIGYLLCVRPKNYEITSKKFQQYK
jgi:hypothetical protein